MVDTQATTDETVAILAQLALDEHRSRDRIDDRTRTALLDRLAALRGEPADGPEMEDEPV